MLTIGIGESLQRWERYDHASPENDKRWIFHLRKGGKFHDGSDFTADDVVWNFKKVRDTEAPHYEPKQAALVAVRILALEQGNKAMTTRLRF